MKWQEMHSKVLVVFTVIDTSRESSVINKILILNIKLDKLLNSLSDFNELIRFILNPDGSYSLVAEYKAVVLEAGVRFSLAALISIKTEFVFQRGALQC